MLNNDRIYEDIAHALARGYTDLYYVNMETDELIEFHTDDERGVLTEARRSDDFFEGCYYAKPLPLRELMLWKKE